MHFLYIITKCLILISLISHGNGEQQRFVSASVEKIIELIKIDNMLINALDRYATELQNKLDALRFGLSELQREQQKAQRNAEVYASNSLNSFPFVRRMTNDWSYWLKFLSLDVEQEIIEEMKAFVVHFPRADEYEMAVWGFANMQTCYKLSARDLSMGIINGIQYDSRMSAIDCYAVGMHLLNDSNPSTASEWLYAAYQTYRDNAVYDKVLHFSRFAIYDAYAKCFTEQNRSDSVLDAACKSDLVYTNLTTAGSEQKKCQNATLHTTNRYHVQDLLCRAAGAKSPSKLVCRYNTSSSAYARLAAFKMEELNIDPYMVIYYNIISDAEIAQIQEKSRSRLERAGLYMESISNTIRKRTAYVTWLNEEAGVVENINKRLGDMTGFDLSTSESLHVINYGIGGVYDQHFDYLPEPLPDGNRIATVLIYMTDVPQGGATVFVRKNLAVFPRKGTALVWYNLDNRVVGDVNTQHAGCPVLVGSKWIMTKWIRSNGQMFLKPCYK